MSTLYELYEISGLGNFSRQIYSPKLIRDPERETLPHTPTLKHQHLQTQLSAPSLSITILSELSSDHLDILLQLSFASHIYRKSLVHFTTTRKLSRTATRHRADSQTSALTTLAEQSYHAHFSPEIHQNIVLKNQLFDRPQTPQRTQIGYLL